MLISWGDAPGYYLSALQAERTQSTISVVGSGVYLQTFQFEIQSKDGS